MKCPACAAELPDDARFCSTCGTPISSISQMATRVSPEGQAPGPKPSSGVGRLATGPGKAGAFTPGTVFADRFRIIGLLGRGGMGEVYRADDLRLGAAVALKFLPPAIARDPVRRERFHAEVRLAREIAHPSVCRVYDIGEHDGRLFLSMEYVDGEDLGSLLHRIGRLPPDKALELAHQLCAGLAAAHDRQVIHRDLKPANVMIDGRGRARITDFGLAVSPEADQVGDRSGTPLYMAPEQIAGEGASVRSDLYALGLTLYEMFTGRRAFDAVGLEELRRQHAFDPPTPPSELVANLPPGAERAILRCLEKDPAARPASARAVAAELPGGDPLEAILAAGETPSPGVVAASGTKGQLSRGRAWSLLALSATVIGLVVFDPASDRLHRVANLERPPEALADEARRILRQAGYDPPARHEARGYDANWTQLEHLESRPRPAGPWFFLKDVNPSPVLFWYRASVLPFAPLDVEGRTTESDPPTDRPGMATVRLDSTGRLQSLRIVPDPGAAAPATPAQPPDWSAFLAAAGLDPAGLSPVPARPPSLYADHRLALGGTAASGDAVRVDAGAVGGRPVVFELQWPWMSAAEASGGQEAFSVADTTLVVATVLAWISGFLLARRNLRLKRGDRRGALLVGVFLFVVLVARFLLIATHRGAFTEEWRLMEGGIGRALFWALAVSVVYLGLEPSVRRRWPGVLVSWARLLRGRARDPLVGRDLLVGILCGASIHLLRGLEYHASALWGRPLPPPGGGVQALGDASARMGALLGGVFGALTDGLGILFLLILFRMVLRRTALACILGTALFALIIMWWERPFWLFSLLTLPRAVAWVALMLRLGLLGTLAALGAWYALLSWPVRLDVAWLSGWNLLLPLALLGLAAWGFKVALGEQPLFGKIDIDA